jgi:hypothetical protein
MRREAHESYGLALELRFDAHREGDALLGSETVVRTRD